MLYGVMLLFYPAYQVRAIKRFESILKKIDPDFRLLLVVNNDSINCDSLSGYNYILGDNSNWEFSGWESALKYLSPIDDTSSVIFSNDTFCHHNLWGVYEINKFSQTFKRLYKKNRRLPSPVLSGSTQTFKEVFSIFGSESDLWVSTYLFLTTGALLNKLKLKMSLSSDEVEKIINIGDDGIVSFSTEISDNLGVHIIDWMYPPENSDGWYNHSDVDALHKKKKIVSILNEKYLSINCIKCGGSIVEVFTIKRVKYFIRKLISKG